METEDVFLRRLENTLLSRASRVGRGTDVCGCDQACCNVVCAVQLRGVRGVRKAFLRESRLVVWSAAGPTTEKEWVLDTEGTNLLEVMAHPRVDFRRTTSNDIRETLVVLGVEGARAALFQELRSVLQFDGSYVNYRHIALLAEVMTYRGHLLSISRNGMSRHDTGPLMRCTFEETVDTLFEGAMFAELDRCTGVSEHIILGKMAPCGTGQFDLLLNEEMLKVSQVARL